MKRCTYEVVILCCQLETALELRDKVILATCCPFFFGALTHRIAVQTPFSDLKSCRMQYLLFFYHWATSFRCFNFFFDCIENFSPGRDILPRKSKKKWIAAAKHIYISVGTPLWSQNSQKRPQKIRVRTVHAKGAECSPPYLRAHQHALDLCCLM
jgi:hypothetical protein